MSLTPELTSLISSVDVFLSDTGRLLLRLAAMFFMAYLLMLVGTLAVSWFRSRNLEPQRPGAMASKPAFLRLETERAGLS